MQITETQIADPARPRSRTHARVTRFCRSGLAAVVSDLRRDGVVESSDELAAARVLLALGIGQMSTPTLLHEHPFQVQPVLGATSVHADIGRLEIHPDRVQFSADLPADTHGPVRVIWFNMDSLTGGTKTLHPHPTDSGYRAEGEVRAGVGVVVAGLVPAADDEGCRAGFALVAE
ncbi:hypothetical protein [Rhodococcus kronopolitis]|uniref:Uncharacterized protein n=1 Tax=Rhodococcus kronopolitis TaxID=1460226 RepID=A0ABV9FX79_9NOCA